MPKQISAKLKAEIVAKLKEGYVLLYVPSMHRATRIQLYKMGFPTRELKYDTWRALIADKTIVLTKRGGQSWKISEYGLR